VRVADKNHGFSHATIFKPATFAKVRILKLDTGQSFNKAIEVINRLGFSICLLVRINFCEYLRRVLKLNLTCVVSHPRSSPSGEGVCEVLFKEHFRKRLYVYRYWFDKFQIPKRIIVY
jgi:hypothetical protein